MPRSGRRWTDSPVARAAALAVLVAAGLLLLAAVALPDPCALAHRPPSNWAFLERHQATGAPAEHRWVPLDRIDEDLQLAVLVAEDINFFDHAGFDFSEVWFALRDWFRGGRLRGASTLTQQLAKNLWLSPRRSVLRKAIEAVLTWRLERCLPKRRILELYLNVVAFGPGIFGAEAAARRYFGRSAADLEPVQAAELAAALSRPSRWHPGVGDTAYRRRVATILRRMHNAGWLRAKLDALRRQSGGPTPAPPGTAPRPAGGAP